MLSHIVCMSRMLGGLDIFSSGRGIGRRLCAAFWVFRHVDSKESRPMAGEESRGERAMMDESMDG